MTHLMTQHRQGDIAEWVGTTRDGREVHTDDEAIVAAAEQVARAQFPALITSSSTTTTRGWSR